MDSSHAEPPQPLRIQTGGRRRSNLVLGLFLLPGERRSDALLFSDFCRTVDDIADSPERTPDEKRDLLEAWLQALKPGQGEALPGEFREMIIRRNLDRRLLSEIVHGMLMDVGGGGLIRFKTCEELRAYCHRVASVVGLLCARIFGASGPVVERYAEGLGVALQLTNILRDIAEDAALGRIYIPMEDLERFGVSERDMLEGASSPAMTHLLNHQAERADSHFAKAESAWSEMTVNQRRLMRPARLMSGIYRDLLLQMHRDRYDVFARRYRVSALQKFLILLNLMTSWR